MRASYDRDLPGAAAGYRRFVTDVSTGNAVARTDQLLTFVGRKVGEDPGDEPAPAARLQLGAAWSPGPFRLRIVAHF